MIVRRAGAADVAALAALQEIGPETLPAFTAWVVDHADTHLPFVAEVDGRVVGAAWLLVAERVPRDDSPRRLFGDVQSVMVRAEHRGRGVGSALMTAILAEARARGLVYVTVHSGRRAVDFYRCNGFRQDGHLLLWRPTDS